MKRLPLSLLAHWAGGELHGDDVLVDTLAHDTRALMPGSLYVALRGERFDGHDFAYDAAMRNAGALLVEHEVAVELPRVVADTQSRLPASIQSAPARPRRAREPSPRNGKTTSGADQSLLQEAVKLSQSGNRNTEACRWRDDAPDMRIRDLRVARASGRQRLYHRHRHPTLALVNNIAPAHLERLGSLMGVAETKGAIYTALPADGVAVINADDAFAEYFAGLASGRRILRFGLDATADVTARDLRSDADGWQFTLVTPQARRRKPALPGRHSVLNALAAASLALACGVSLATIALGLAATRPVPGRQVPRTLANGAILIDDSYNANPGSLAAAIDTLAAAGGEAWLVLGDMRELGEDGEAMHADVGRRAKSAGIRRLYTLGPLSAAAAQTFGDGARSFDTHGALAEALRSDLQDAAQPQALRCLVKGSRGSAMDRVVNALLHGEGTPHAA